MNEEDVKLLILGYFNDGFEDTEYIARIVNALPFVQVSALICDMLLSDDYQTFSIAELFLRDAILYGSRNEDCHQFIADYPQSSITKALEKLIFSNNYSIQHQAIYALGKTGSYSSKHILRQAFDLYRDANPLLLNRLIFEMRCLGVDGLENCLEQMAASSSYLTRWAAVEHIDDLQNAIFPDWVERLRRDEREVVRVEAEYECQQIIKSIQTPVLSKIKQRQRSKEIKKIEPKISFQDMSIRFGNYLATNRLSNYTVTELEAYIEREFLV